MDEGRHVLRRRDDDVPAVAPSPPAARVVDTSLADERATAAAPLATYVVRGAAAGACLGSAMLLFFGGLLVLWLFLGFLHLPGQVAGGIGDRAGQAIQRTGVALAAAAQALQDARDPLHPPRYPVAQDL